MAVAFERDRKAFFENCLNTIAEVKGNTLLSFVRRVLKPDPKGRNNLPVEIAKKTIGGRADLALRAYQLIQATRLISAQKYISPSDGQDFADILWAQVCGTHMDDVCELLDRYYEKRDAEEERLGFDVALYITGDPAWALRLTAVVMMQTTQLTGHTAMIVATAFGDEETVQDIRAQLERKQKQ